MVKGYAKAVLIDYPYSATIFSDALPPPKNEKGEIERVAGILFTANEHRLLKSLMYLQSNIFTNKIKDYNALINNLFKNFKDIMEGKDEAENTTRKKIEHTSNSITPYIAEKLNTENYVYRKNSETTITLRNLTLVRTVNKTDMQNGIQVIPAIRREFYTDEDSLYVEYVSSLAKMRLTLIVCEEVIDYYNKLSDEEDKKKYKDVYDYLKKVKVVLEVFSNTEDANLYEPLIRYVLPLSFVPVNIDGNLETIVVKTSMFFKNKSPDEVLVELSERRKDKFTAFDANPLEGLKRRINNLFKKYQGVDNGFDFINKLMQEVYEGQNGNSDTRKNDFLADLRALFLDYYLLERPLNKAPVAINPIMFTSRESKTSFIKKIKELKVHFPVKTFEDKNGQKRNVLGAYVVADYNAEKNTKEILEGLEGSIKRVIGSQSLVKTRSVRELYKYLGIDTQKTPEIELVLPFFKEIENFLQESKDYKPLKHEESLKLIFSLFYFTCFVYYFTNNSRSASYLYLALSKEYKFVDYIRQFYEMLDLPVQVVTTRVLNKIKNNIKSSKSPNAYEKNLFLSSLKTFKKSYFEVEMEHHLEGEFFVILEERTESIGKDGLRHYVFTVYKININKKEDNTYGINCSLYGKYISFFTISDYIHNLITDIHIKHKKAKFFLLRRASSEKLTIPSEFAGQVKVAYLLDVPMLFVKSSQLSSGGRISVLPNNDAKQLMLDIFTHTFSNSGVKRAFGLSPAFVYSLVEDFKDGKGRLSFHTDFKLVVLDDEFASEEDEKDLMCCLLSIMNHEAEGFSEESSFSKISLPLSKKSREIEIKRKDYTYTTKLNHVLVELAGLVGLGYLNRGILL